jgi:hypothetical protein
VNLDSARRSTIEACGPNDEAIVKTMAAETREGPVDLRSAEQVNEVNREDRLGKAAASPNSQNQRDRGIKSAEHSEWEVWEQSLPAFISPKRAKGFVLHEDTRKRAGVPDDWIQNLKRF